MNDEKMLKLQKEYANKEVLAKIVKDNLEEFKDMEIEEIKKWFIQDPIVNKKKVLLPDDDCELTYGIYFKLFSPKLDYDHEITCVVELRDQEISFDIGELPASAGLSLMLLCQSMEEQIHKNISERCYGIYIFMNPKNKKGKCCYDVNFKMNNQRVLEKHYCQGIDIYL